MSDLSADIEPVGYYIVNTANVYSVWDRTLHTTPAEARESLADPLEQDRIRPEDHWVVVECWPIEVSA